MSLTDVLWLRPQCLQNQSSDIRLMTERVLWWVCKEAETPALEPNLVKPVIKALLDNTKDKNTSVRAQSEHTLVSLLQLRQGESGMQVSIRNFAFDCFASGLYFRTGVIAVFVSKIVLNIGACSFRASVRSWTWPVMSFCQNVTEDP